LGLHTQSGLTLDLREPALQAGQVAGNVCARRCELDCTLEQRGGLLVTPTGRFCNG